MLNLKLGKAQLSIRFGYEATVRSGIIKRLVHMTTIDKGNLEYMDIIMELVPEMILVGAQKFHSAEYGYDYKTEDGKEQALSKIYSLLDDYFEEEDANFMDLMESLQNELMNNGFLAKMFKEEVKKTEKKEEKEKK